MHNPFDERIESDAGDRDLARAAVAGDRTALEELVLRHQAWIYNVALRMVWEPSDAEDVTQEALIKIVTKLSTYREDSSFRTWVYRIVANHVLNMQRRPAEPESLSFGEFGAALQSAPDRDLPDKRAMPVDLPLLVEEAKLGCTIAMLMCLDRRQRLIYVLGELFGVSHSIGGEILETSPANFRQLLSRARRDLHRFMAGQCGLVDPRNPCRCPRKTRGFMEKGYVDPNNLRFARDFDRRMRDIAPAVSNDLESAVERQAREVQLEQPFATPPDIARTIGALFACMNDPPSAA